MDHSAGRLSPSDFLNVSPSGTQPQSPNLPLNSSPSRDLLNSSQFPLWGSPLKNLDSPSSLPQRTVKGGVRHNPIGPKPPLKARIKLDSHFSMNQGSAGAGAGSGAAPISPPNLNPWSKQYLAPPLELKAPEPGKEPSETIQMLQQQLLKLNDDNDQLRQANAKLTECNLEVMTENLLLKKDVANLRNSVRQFETSYAIVKNRVEVLAMEKANNWRSLQQAFPGGLSLSSVMTANGGAEWMNRRLDATLPEMISLSPSAGE